VCVCVCMCVFGAWRGVGGGWGDSPKEFLPEFSLLRCCCCCRPGGARGTPPPAARFHAGHSCQHNGLTRGRIQDYHQGVLSLPPHPCDSRPIGGKCSRPHSFGDLRLTLALGIASWHSRKVLLISDACAGPADRTGRCCNICRLPCRRQQG